MLKRAYLWLSRAIAFLKRKRISINRRMRDHYNPAHLALGICGVAFVLISIMLFTPPYLGYSNDGRFERVMNSVGLTYIDESQVTYNEYYQRIYKVVGSGTGEMSYAPAVVLATRVAMELDWLFTRDDVFDLRFLALLYMLVFLFAFYVLLLQVQRRVQTFIECLVVVVLGLFIFADVASVSFFGSLYPEPLLLISMMLATGTAMSFENERREYVKLGLLLIASVTLCFSEVFCCVAAMFFAIYMVKLLTLHRDLKWRISCAGCALITTFCALLSLGYLYDGASKIEKYHAMTRGVLLQSADPEDALSEFGIAPSYAVLADTTRFHPYPFVLAESGVLDEGFLGQYDARDIAAYYLRHPASLVTMVNLVVEDSFNVRPIYSGNYEKEADRMPGAKSLFFSAWSTFKMQSAPHTGAFLLALVVAAVILFRKSLMSLLKEKASRGSIPLDVAVITFCTGIGLSILVVITQGDTDLTRFSSFISVVVDLLIFLVFCELLHKLNIIRGDKP